MEKASTDSIDFSNRSIECGLIGVRWFMKSSDLSDELNRCRMDLFRGRGRIEVE